MRSLLSILMGAACVLLPGVSAAHAQGVTQEALLKGHRGDPSAWPMYGGNYQQDRFSELAQIDVANVASLRPAWTFHTGIFNVASGYQTTPVVVGGSMYVTTPRVGTDQWVVKLDARTGAEIWSKALPQGASRFCCGANNRGVAALDDKVYVATIDAALVALRESDGEIAWKTQTAKGEQGYSQTSAPLAFDGKVFLGAAGGEYGIRGFLKAYDAATGDLEWTWHAIPSPEDGGWLGNWTETAPGTGLSLHRDIAAEKASVEKYPDAWEHGGVPIWTTPSLDPELRLIYVTTGNPGPDYDGTVRPGDNLWGDSICAIRVDDGTLAWGFQYVPHDIWDYDGGSPPILFDAEIDGSRRAVVGLLTKVGFFYLLDRKTGELLKVSDPYVPQENLFAPLTPEGVTIAPGSAGGTNWSPGAYHPGTGLVYSANVHWPMVMKTAPGLAYNEGASFQGGNASFGGETDVKWGYVTALDPVSGKKAWESKTELPLFSGMLATAGGLVFAGQGGGSFDAWDAKTGAHLWAFKTDAGCNAAPIAYSLDGRQFVAVSAGGSRYVRRDRDNPPKADAIIAFALP